MYHFTIKILMAAYIYRLIMLSNRKQNRVFFFENLWTKIISSERISSSLRKCMGMEHCYDRHSCNHSLIHENPVYYSTFFINPDWSFDNDRKILWPVTILWPSTRTSRWCNEEFKHRNKAFNLLSDFFCWCYKTFKQNILKH